MKRLGRSTIMVLIALLLIVMPALAGPRTLSINTSQCEQVSITATHRSQTSNMIKLAIDGIVVAGKTGWLTVSLGYTGSVSSGNHVAVAKYFERRWSQRGQEFYWKLMHTVTRVFQIDACGEQCGRCSNIKPFTYVEWFDRDGGCDSDWYNERVEYPNDRRCGYEMCNEVGDPVYGGWSDWELNCDPVSCNWLRTRDAYYYDANYSEHFCYNEPESEIKDAIGGCMDEEAENYNSEAEYEDGSCEFYQVCDAMSGPFYSEWTEWFLEDSIWMRHRYIEYFDSQDPERQCDLQIETETRDAILGCTDSKAMNFDPTADIDDGSCTYPKPVCPLQLLINYNPPEGWLPFCMVLTEGAVAVHRQPAICSWIADNQPCGGMVYDDGTEQGIWRCDRYGYERRPIVVLKCLWQRHLNGQRDLTSFRKCQALAP